MKVGDKISTNISEVPLQVVQISKPDDCPDSKLYGTCVAWLTEVKGELT